MVVKRMLGEIIAFSSMRILKEISKNVHLITIVAVLTIRSTILRGKPPLWLRSGRSCLNRK